VDGWRIAIGRGRRRFAGCDVGFRVPLIAPPPTFAKPLDIPPSLGYACPCELGGFRSVARPADESADAASGEVLKSRGAVAECEDL